MVAVVVVVVVDVAVKAQNLEVKASSLALGLCMLKVEASKDVIPRERWEQSQVLFGFQTPSVFGLHALLDLMLLILLNDEVKRCRLDLVKRMV